MTATMPDGGLNGLIEQVLEAYNGLDEAKGIGTEFRRLYVLRQRARIGAKIAAARRVGPRGTQSRIAGELGYSDREVPRRFEAEYRAWVARFPDDNLFGEADWNAIFQRAGLLQIAS